MSFGNVRRIGTAKAAARKCTGTGCAGFKTTNPAKFQVFSPCMGCNAGCAIVQQGKYGAPYEPERYLLAAVIAAFCCSSVRPR